ncbi:MAG: site-specific integrase [Campylobacterales bacterium]|nr:site-specific integrase [Campylobacterales bacterium]
MNNKRNYIKTQYPGVYYTQDSITKVKTFIARIKIAGIIDTEVVVGRSDDEYRTNLVLANQRRAELISEAKNGGNIRKSDNPIFEEYVQTYIDNKKPTMAKYWESNIRGYFKIHIPDILKRKRVKDITEQDFQKALNELIKKGYSGRYCKALKDHFLPVFDTLVKVKTIDANPLANLQWPKYDNMRSAYLTDEQIKRFAELIGNIYEDNYRIIMKFLLRGRRLGEVLKLEWRDLDFVAKQYTVRPETHKIRKTARYTLDDELLEELQNYQAKEITEGLVFKSDKTGGKLSGIPDRIWHKLREEIEAPELHIHDIRHIVGVTLINNGVPIEIISKTLGHKQITTTQRYSRMKEEMAAKGVEAFLGIVKK